MRRFLVITSISFLGFIAGAASAESNATNSRPKSVLFVLSSEGKYQGKTRPGYEMDELAQAWSIFRANGVHTAFASPRGGAAEADKFNPADPANAQLLADPEASAALKQTQAIAQVDPKRHDAIYVVGGKGAMFDLATDKALIGLLGDFYERGGVVAAICHGSAALADVRRADGKYLVTGRAVTGFTEEEETIFGKKWRKEFPFEIEPTLRERGALWKEAPLMMPSVAIDGRLLTGQNPFSTGRLADAVLRALGIEPAAREFRKDEASMALAEQAIQGDRSAAAVLASAPANYQPELIAMLGHFQLQVAQDEKSVRTALTIMDLAAPYFEDNRLSVSRAEALSSLGRTEEARTILAAVLAKAPDMPEALKLQGKLPVK